MILLIQILIVRTMGSHFVILEKMLNSLFQIRSVTPISVTHKFDASEAWDRFHDTSEVEERVAPQEFSRVANGVSSLAGKQPCRWLPSQHTRHASQRCTIWWVFRRRGRARFKALSLNLSRCKSLVRSNRTVSARFSIRSSLLGNQHSQWFVQQRSKSRSQFSDYAS